MEWNPACETSEYITRVISYTFARGSSFGKKVDLLGVLEWSKVFMDVTVFPWDNPIIQNPRASLETGQRAFRSPHQEVCGHYYPCAEFQSDNWAIWLSFVSWRRIVSSRISQSQHTPRVSLCALVAVTELWLLENSAVISSSVPSIVFYHQNGKAQMHLQSVYKQEFQDKLADEVLIGNLRFMWKHNLVVYVYF